jgi:hypothetical protein
MGSSGRNPLDRTRNKASGGRSPRQLNASSDVRRGLAYEFNYSSFHIKAPWFAHRLELKKYGGGECELPLEGKERIHDLILSSGSFDRLIHIAGEVPIMKGYGQGGRGSAPGDT